jgi:hypothetical protein
MNRLEPQARSPGDDELDALLTTFFEHELPEPLRRRNGFASPQTRGAVQPVVRVVAPSHETNGRPRRSRKHAASVSGIAGLLLLGLGCLAALTLPPWRVGDEAPAVESPVTDAASAGERLRSSAPASAEAGLPVELRTDDDTVPVAVPEAETGAKVEVDVEELDVEIIPIKDGE